MKPEENNGKRRLRLSVIAAVFIGLAVWTAIVREHVPASSESEVLQVTQAAKGRVIRREANQTIAAIKKQARDHGFTKTEAVLKKYFPKVVDYVRIVQGELSTNDLRIICSHPPLRALDINGTKLSAAHYDIIARAQQLEKLYLSGAAVHVPSVGKLASLTGLKELDLDHTQLSDQDLEFVSKLQRLEFLSLTQTSIKGSVLREVRTLPRLNYLDISYTKVTDSYLTNLSRMPTLTDLYLGEHITDKGVPHFVGLTNLRTLGLMNSHVDNPGLNRILKGLPNLTNLNLFYVEAFIGKVDWKAYPNVVLQAAY